MVSTRNPQDYELAHGVPMNTPSNTLPNSVFVPCGATWQLFSPETHRLQLSSKTGQSLIKMQELISPK